MNLDKLLAEQHRNTRHDAVAKILEIRAKLEETKNLPDYIDSMLNEITGAIMNLKLSKPLHADDLFDDNDAVNFMLWTQGADCNWSLNDEDDWQSTIGIGSTNNAGLYRIYRTFLENQKKKKDAMVREDE